jgi:hypothetical protein
MGREKIMAIQKKSLRVGSRARKNAKASTGAVQGQGTPRGTKEVNLNAGALKFPAVQ